jgi:acyl-CoA thioesterase-1
MGVKMKVRGRDLVRAWMWSVVIVFCVSAHAEPFEIHAIGTSNIHSHGVTGSQTFCARLEELLRADGYDVRVIDDGIDGDLPMWMLQRLDRSITANTRLVIFEPGPNDRSTSRNVDYSEQVLAVLRDRRIPTIYVSNRRIQTEQEGAATAAKFGASYYGEYRKGLSQPISYIDRGHLSGDGTAQWAQNMLPLVKQTLSESKSH